MVGVVSFIILVAVITFALLTFVATHIGDTDFDSFNILIVILISFALAYLFAYWLNAHGYLGAGGLL